MNNMKEIKSKWFKWWKYASFLKFFGVAFASVAISLGFGLLIPNAWCSPFVFATCGVGGYFMRKLLPDVLKDLQNAFYWE
jgi:hypothetical protein